MHCWIHLYPLEKTRWAWQFYFHLKILVLQAVLMASGPQWQLKYCSQRGIRKTIDHTGWKQWCKIAWNLHGKNVLTKATTSLSLDMSHSPREKKKKDVPTQFQQLYFENKCPACPPRISSSNPVVVLVHTHETEQQILFSLCLQPPSDIALNRNCVKHLSLI